VEKKNTVPDRFRQIRGQLGLTQQQLADRLFLSRNYIAKIESGVQEPSARVLRDLELLRVDSGNSASLQHHYRDSGSREAPPVGMVEERTSPMVDPRFQPRSDPTPQMCFDHFQRFLALAAEQPGGVGYTWHQLQKHFPLDEFEERKPLPQ